MNGVYGACSGFLPFGVPGTGLGIVHISTFPPFWTGAAARKAAVLFIDNNLYKKALNLFISGVFKLAALGLRLVAATPCGLIVRGTRSPWILRVRCLPCAIILANALTERVWSAAPGLREKRSWAASLFTLARARRSLPSSDLNGHCLSRGVVSLATRGQKRACRAKHPAAKQGGTAEFSRPWVSEKRPRTVFYCRVRAGGAWAPCRQERKIDESDR